MLHILEPNNISTCQKSLGVSNHFPYIRILLLYWAKQNNQGKRDIYYLMFMNMFYSQQQYKLCIFLDHLMLVIQNKHIFHLQVKPVHQSTVYSSFTQ